MTDLSALLERVRAATGPDPFIDMYLNEAFYDMSDERPEFMSCQRFTASLDAAVKLAERVLPGWDWELYGGKSPNTAAAVINIRREYHQEFAATPALALVAAILSALIAKDA